jgi:hypothetical protein
MVNPATRTTWLRALSGFYRVEVRVLSGASKSPANAGVFVSELSRRQVEVVPVITAVITNGASPPERAALEALWARIRAEMTPIYGTREEIFRDFDLAVKFVIERPNLLVHNPVDPNDRQAPEDDYTPLYRVLIKEHQAQLTQIIVERQGVAGSPAWPEEVGLFLEIPVAGDSGASLGTRFVLVPHETGVEIFIATTLGGWVIKKVMDVTVGPTVDRWIEGIRRKRSKVKIDHVELRTTNKGVMRLPFSEFRGEQLTCLVERLPSIENLVAVNQECFSGHLIRLPSASPD